MNQDRNNTTDGFEFDKRAVVTIQGGGLYALTLLGQLSAVLQDDIQIHAIAGTSAGAIIATLIWAGWSPRELRDRLSEYAREKTLELLPGEYEPPNDPFDFGTWTSFMRDIGSTSSMALHAPRSRMQWLGRALHSISLSYNAWSIFGRCSPTTPTGDFLEEIA